MPNLHIITGSNGAGKSSIGPNYLPESIQLSCKIFDGDKLFMQKKQELWNSGSRAIKENKKIAFKYISELFDNLVDGAINQNADFAYEGHFTNDSTWEIPKKFKNLGYSIHLIFFGLIDTNLSELRVVNRVQEGGHYVDPLEIEANYYGNLEKLNVNYELFDSIQIVDTSETVPRVLCLLEDNKIISCVQYSSLPDWFISYLPELTKRIQLQSASF